MKFLIESFTNELGNPMMDAPGYDEYSARRNSWEEKESARQAVRWCQIGRNVGVPIPDLSAEEAKQILDDWINEEQEKSEMR